MKKRKMLRNVSLVALSAVMLSGVALAATACGESGGSANEITVNIFCSKADEHTNRTICDNWAAEYSKKIGREIKVKFNSTDQKDTYLSTLDNSWAGGLGSIADIVYLSPKYVQSYANAGYVMDLSQYLVGDGAGATASGIWENALSYYGYKANSKDYTLGQQIEYKADGADGPGFYTKGGISVGVYALPKDYSNFSMGYNKKYFTDELRYEYQTRKGSEVRNVSNGSKVAGESGNNYTKKYTGDATNNKANYVATFAASGKYQVWNPKTNSYEERTATKGEEAPILCIGVPVTYKPFNFYRYNDFESARQAGDPMACTVEAFSFHSEGYTVTIPGFPGDTFDIAETIANTHDGGAYYDSSMGHIVYTYAEYGALVWAVTYYLNTFDFQNKDGDNNPLTGNGGLTVGGEGVRQVIYGSEQYEGKQGNALYLLPWVASNDADLIDPTSSKCYNNGAPVKTTGATYASDTAATGTEPVSKLNLDGTTRTVPVQYGFNSERFIETYAAYQEFGSTWNGNSGNAGDEASTKANVSGWDYFCSGAAVFYGAGTWDAATRNDTAMDVFEFGQMPSPVAEKYALYSRVNNADYTTGGKIYSNANNAKSSGDAVVNNDAAQRGTTLSALNQGCKVYSEQQETYDELIRNQILRQDKWAARMDSVGYAANGRFAKITDSENKEYWKKEGCASLIQALTVGEEGQLTLTYAGAQLPNYKEQCKDFLYYQDSAKDKSFKDMITPEGSATVGGHKTAAERAEGRALWDKYYQVAVAMARASQVGSSDRSKTVSEWIASQTASAYGLNEIKYDPQYANTRLSEFTGESGTNYGFAMKVLRMVAFTYADRDLNIRMQYGLNSVRDSSMYTVSDSWLGYINASSSATKMIAYRNQQELGDIVIQNLGGTAVARTLLNATAEGVDIWTPAVYCMTYAHEAQKGLTQN